MTDLDDRLADLEERIRRLEEARGTAGAPAVTAEVPVGATTPPRQRRIPAERERPPLRSDSPPAPPIAAAGVDEPRLSVATGVLGVSGAVALVLAAMYLIRLAIDSGWLTPTRQIGLATLSGLALIGLGLMLAGRQPGAAAGAGRRRYAALLPGAGVVILFLTVYGAHVYHGLISAPVATAAVASVCLASLWLGHVFGTDLYALFAVVGAYSTPFFLSTSQLDLEDLLIYFSAWSILFCVHALWVGSRTAYLVAMYLAIVGFDLIWRDAGQPDWSTAAIYQAIQFFIFTATAVVYSVRRDEPMTETEAACGHMPALLIFYVLEYSILDRHLEAWAPWIAFASVLALFVAHFVATRVMRRSTAASGAIVGVYAVLVTLHAGYVELLPGRWAPWVALAAVLASAVLARGDAGTGVTARLAQLALFAVFALNYLRVLSDLDMSQVPGEMWLRLLYPAVLYAGYGLTRQEEGRLGFRVPLLYAAHIAAMAAVVWFVDASFLTSVLWGTIAVAGLTVAVWLRDRPLGRSSFLVFAVSGLKVLLYDLAGAAPLVRIGSLVALGVSLFVGGWLYQELSTSSTPRQRSQS